MGKVGNSALHELYLGSFIAERKLHKMGHKMSNRNEYRNLTQPFLEFVGRAVAFCFHIPKTRPFWMVMVLALGIPFRNFDDFNVSVKDDFI